MKYAWPWLALFIVVAAVMAFKGQAWAQFNRCGPGFCPGGVFGPAFRPPGSSVPPQTGKILMTDGTSFVLQTDGASKICIAGGC